MKRTTILLTLLLLASATLLAGERQVTFEQLPQRAQQFIKTHFQELKLSYAKYDNDITDRDYEVHFTDGTQIEFERDGTWSKIESGHTLSLPRELLPENILNYINANFPERAIVQIERDRRHWEVELSGDVELMFDRHSRLVDVD